MKSPSHFELLRGGGEAPPRATPLRAGPLSLLLEGGDLKYVRLGDREVLRRVYAAVRDQNWGTVPARISDLRIEPSADTFRVSYTAEHVRGEIDFAWRGTIEGTAAGAIRFDFDGEARSTFLRNRIGFCVLHPPAIAGGPCWCTHAGGTAERGAWPERISPWAPFKDIRALAHEVLPGLRARVDFDGEIFEMEDHRNWTDASFKTFCTPLALPYPVEVTRGTRVRQSVSLSLEGPAPPASLGGGPEAPAWITVGVPAEVPVVRVGTGEPVPLPAIGLGAASHGRPLAPREIERLRRLHLAHLRVDLRLSRPGWEEALRRAAGEARELGARLEAALFVTGDAARELRALASLLGEARPPVARWLVHHERERASTAPWLKLAREILGGGDPSAKIGGGTDAEFVDLNRRPPPRALLDFGCYSINPQVHAFDDDSLVETLGAQRSTVESARALLGGLPLAITPVTLKRRFNPDATGPAPDPAPGELPPEVDPRQMSLFAAVWTAGSLKHLAEGGAESVTYFETTGWRGVLESEEGPPLPERFPSIPGGAFPLYHVLADAGEMGGGLCLPSVSSHPLEVEALAMRSGGSLRILVANLRPQAKRVLIEGLPERMSLRRLDASSVLEAMRAPEAFRERPGEARSIPGGVLALELAPYGVTRIDGE